MNHISLQILNRQASMFLFYSLKLFEERCSYELILDHDVNASVLRQALIIDENEEKNIFRTQKYQKFCQFFIELDIH